MKRTSLIIFFLLIGQLAIAQEIDDTTNIHVELFTIKQDGDMVYVTFRGEALKKITWNGSDEMEFTSKRWLKYQSTIEDFNAEYFDWEGGTFNVTLLYFKFDGYEPDMKEPTTNDGWVLIEIEHLYP